jgi:hypothetical protein
MAMKSKDSRFTTGSENEDPNPIKMNVQQIQAAEAKAVADLEAAHEAYRTASRKLRQEISAHLEAIRTEAGITRERMGALIGASNRNLIFMAEKPVEGGRFFGVPRLLEILAKYEAAIAFHRAVGGPLEIKGRGRPRKNSPEN